MFSFVVSEHYL